MALTGVPLLVVLGLVALLLPVATFVMWPRVRGPRLVRGGSRLGMLLAGQLATVLLFAALANDYGEFYTSWGDIVGRPGGTTTLQTYGGAGGALSAKDTSPAGRLRVIGDTGWSTRSQWATRGRVESVTIDGLGSHIVTPGYVYLPPQYFQHGWSHRRFPGVEVLTGYPGSADSLVTRVNYPGMVLTALRHHRMRPMVFVMLSSTVAPPRDTECTDIPHGPQAQTFLAQEVPDAARRALRVRPDDWAIMGDSTGGYCAAKIAMTHYGVFRAGVSLSGYYFALHDVTTGNLWGGSKALRHLNSPEWLAVHRSPPTSLFVTISKQETHREGYPDTRRFLREVHPPLRVTALIESKGGHNYSTWDREIPVALHWLSPRLSERS